MNQTRTIFGLLIMIFFAIPALFGIIWAVGLTQAVVSEKVLSELPREVIAELPDLLDGVLLAGRDENIHLDGDTRTWLTAMSGVRTTPRELLKETGLNGWLEKELAGSLRTMGDILNGKAAARDVWLDLRPLKQALSHPAMEHYLAQVLEKLPVCSSGQAQTWERIIRDQDHYDSLPPCRPETTPTADTLAIIRSHVTRDIPDEVNILETVHFPFHKVNIAKTVMSFTYLLFLIPAGLIALGALVVARSKSHFFRWSGAVIMIGGGLVLAMTTLIKQAIPWAMHFNPEHYSSHWLYMHDVLTDKLGGIALVFARHLISPVIAVAGTVCVVGLLLFAFSFTFTREIQPPRQTQ